MSSTTLIFFVQIVAVEDLSVLFDCKAYFHQKLAYLLSHIVKLVTHNTTKWELLACCESSVLTHNSHHNLIVVYVTELLRLLRICIIVS
jgi:hypothetical protein